MFHSLWESCLDVLFPPHCVLCNAPGGFLCESHLLPPPPENQAHFEYVNEIYAITKYRDPLVEKIVESFKFQGVHGLGKSIASRMVIGLPTDFFAESILVPIPLHWTRKFWRGFNQSEILVKSLQKQANIPWSPLLQRKKRTAQQARLNKKERLKNMKDAFQIAIPDPLPQRVILVDDVIASGTTMDSAAKVLKAHGVKTVVGLIFARSGEYKSEGV